jgi:hypothetical protein
MMANNEGRGWVLKAPFVTNSMHFMYFISSPEEVLWRLEMTSKAIFEDKECYEIPYMMLQPRMLNRKEYKVVLLNGQRSHIAPLPSSHKECKAYSKSPHTRLFEFAETAVKLLADAQPHAILDGLVRVDIFETQEKESYVDANGIIGLRNRWVVNEFESIEAQFTSTATKDALVLNFLHNYWIEKINNAILEIMSYNNIK